MLVRTYIVRSTGLTWCQVILLTRSIKLVIKNHAFSRVQVCWCFYAYSWHEIDNSFPLFDVMMWFSRAAAHWSASVHILFIRDSSDFALPRLLRSSCNLILIFRTIYVDSNRWWVTVRISLVRWNREAIFIYFTREARTSYSPQLRRLIRNTYTHATVGQRTFFFIYNRNLESDAREKCDATYITISWMFYQAALSGTFLVHGTCTKVATSLIMN